MKKLTAPEIVVLEVGIFDEGSHFVVESKAQFFISQDRMNSQILAYSL